MPTDYFLKLDDLQGDSTDSSHPNEIVVVSWSWGQAQTGGDVGSGAGRVDKQDLQFTAKTGKASPILFQAAASGQAFQSAVLTARKPGGAPFEYWKMTLEDVRISSYQVAGNANDDVPMDQVGLQFAKLQVTYTPQNPSTGAPGAPITRGRDYAANRNF
jgi:type VI secretion system secreted protein Hcp